MEVWEEWEEHGGMKGKTCSGMVENKHLESDNQCAAEERLKRDNQSEMMRTLMPANVG